MSISERSVSALYCTCKNYPDWVHWSEREDPCEYCRQLRNLEDARVEYMALESTLCEIANKVGIDIKAETYMMWETMAEIVAKLRGEE